MQVSSYWKYHEANRRYIENNRQLINARKRERRKQQKLLTMQGKRCLNCDILMVERCKGVRIYCESCVKNYPIEVRRHRWRRYYNRKKGNKKEKLKPIGSIKYIQSWSTLKTS